jgi:hypothetical protein
MSADLVSKLAELLVSTFSTTDSSIRTQAETALAEFSHNLLSFSQALLQIMQTHPGTLAQSAGAHLCNTLTQAASEGRLQGSDKQAIGLLLGQTVVQSNLDSTLKMRLAESLSGLMTDQDVNLADLIQPLVLQALQGDVGSVLGGLKVLRPMYQTLMETQDFSQKNYLELLASLVFKAIQGVQTAVKEASDGLMSDAVAVLCEVSCCLQSIIEYYEITSMQGMASVVKLLPLIEAIVQTLLCQLPEPGNPSYHSVVNVSPIPVLTQMNEAKAYMLDSLSHLINFVIDFPEEDTFTPEQSEAFWHVVQPSIDPVLAAVLELSRPDLQECLDHDSVKDYLTKALDFITALARELRLASFFLPRSKALILNCVMLLMVASRQEIEEFEESPEQFLSLASDTCEKQESKIPKTCAAGLLDILCVCVDGCLSFTAHLCTQLVCSISQGVDSIALAELAESPFCKLSKDSQLETCLTILSVLGKHVQRRYDLQAVLDSMLQTTCSSLLTATHPLLLCRLCSFIYYNAEHLSRDNDSLFNHLVLVILRAVQDTSVAAATAGADCLSYMLKEQAVSFKLLQMLDQVVQVVLNCVVGTRVKGVFDALEEIALSFTEGLTPYVSSLLAALVQRVLSEQHAVLKMHSKESIFIIKSWNIIRILAEAPQMHSKLDELEQVLLPLLSSIRDPEAITYDEDLVLLVHTLITKRKAVSQVCWEVFAFLPGVQAKNRSVFFQMFELLNAYICYGKDTFSSSPGYIEQLVHMCENCLFANYNSRANEAMSSEGAIILQLMLQGLPRALDSCLERVLEKCFEKYSRTIVNEFFRVRLLGVILSAFIYDAQLTQQLMAARTIGDSSWLKFALSQIATYRSHFTARYDRKLAVIGLCTLISHPMLESDVVNMLSLLFETVVSICSLSINKKQASQDMDLVVEISLKKKKQAKRKLKKLQDADARQSQLLTQMNSIDELEFFKQMLKSIANSSSGLKYLVGGMQPEMLKVLEQLVQSKTVALQGQEAVRKVIRAKRQV